MQTLSSLETLASARNARRREYARNALAEYDRRVSLENVALSLGLAEIWQDHADGVHTPCLAVG